MMTRFNPRSFHLQWHLTERCNLRCKHCYQEANLLKQEIETEEVLRILDDFTVQIRKWELPKDAARISLTGGEPLLKEDFFKILEKCRDNHSLFRYGILTNGTLLTKSLISKISDHGVDYVQISLEGIGDVNDEIRGKGVFKKAIAAAEMVKERGIDTAFSMTVTKFNLHDVPNMIALSKEMGISLGIRRCVPCGSGREMKESLLSPREVRSLWHYTLKARSNFWENIGLGCEDGMLTQDIPSYMPGECSAGYASFSILPNADVYPCRRLPIYSGNLMEESFDEIYQNSEALRELRDLNNINDVCHSCPHDESCHGGAKCMAFSFFGDALAPDPQCWRLFNLLPDSKLVWKNGAKERVEKLNTKWIKIDGDSENDCRSCS